MQFYDALTDFIFVRDEPEKSDIIFVPGGSYPDAARHAAALYHAGYAPAILPSGRYSILNGCFRAPEGETGEFATEWEYLAHVLRREGVPGEAILKEDQATFTWENAIYSRKLLEEKGICVKTAILSCQAFHARRCLMYYQEQFPGVTFRVCPVETRKVSAESWFRTEEGIDLVLGEVERCGGQFHEIMKDWLRRGKMA